MGATPIATQAALPPTTTLTRANEALKTLEDYMAKCSVKQKEKKIFCMPSFQNS